MATWDTHVALAFAAEELLFAAQAITSDSIPTEQGFGMAHYRMRVLSENGKSLPVDLAERVTALEANYSDRETSGATDIVSAMAIVAATLDLLSDVRNRLNEASQGSS